MPQETPPSSKKAKKSNEVQQPQKTANEQLPKKSKKNKYFFLAHPDALDKKSDIAKASKFVIDEEKLKQEARLDGLWVLRTNMEDEAEIIARSYKMLWMVEDLIRTTKSILETRPIYHKRDETIRGHVFCSFLALSLKIELERRMRDEDVEWEWAEIIRGLNQLREVEATLQGKTYLLRSMLTGHAHQALKAVRAAPPPTLRELPTPESVVPKP